MGECMNKLCLALGVLATAIAVPAAAVGQAADTASPTPPAPVEGYILGPGDVIEVTIADSPDYKGHAPIEADGTVVLPLIGRVTAANLSLTRFRGDIRDLLIKGGYFVRPEVSVVLVTAASRYATVLGEVGSPGVVALDRVYHLSEVIARVGGTKSADTVTLTSPSGQSKDYSLSAIATAAGDGDPVVEPGAKIFVAAAKTFYIYGQVAQPGTFPIDPGLTVRQAIARGGGLTQLGSERKVKLFRANREMKASLDEKILPGDTVVVGERFF